MVLNDSNLPDAPLIGLTTYLEQAQTGVWNTLASFLPAAYFQAVTRAGGIAVLLPPQPVSTQKAERIIAGLDGLIITGGKDVNPAKYGQQAHPSTDEPRLDRDEWEEALLRVALERELPFLGICRGAQVLNVACGGTLHQHLPDLIGTEQYQAGGGVFNSVEVSVSESSRLAAAFNGSEKLKVPVYHHQSIDRLGEGLQVSATTADGVIEAVEYSAVPFAVGVQWHPEESPEDLRLFSELVEAAKTYREGKK